MKYSIKQSSKSVDNNRWEWKVWIEAPDLELDKIKEVIWYLHESFPKRVIKTTDRKNKFELKQIGLSIFLLHAEVNLINNDTINLSHHLNFDTIDAGNKLTPEGEEKINPPDSRVKVFFSYGVEDDNLVKKVQKNWREAGFKVQDMNSCNPAMPYKLARQKLMKESDLVIGLVSSDVTSPIVLDDMNRAKQLSKEVLALVYKDIKPLGLNPELQRISSSKESDNERIEKISNSTMEKLTQSRDDKGLTKLLMEDSQRPDNWQKAEQILDTGLGKPQHYNNLAYKYWENGQIDKAIKLAEKGLKIAINSKEEISVGSLKNSLAYYYADGEYTEKSIQALNFANEALTIAKKLHGEQSDEYAEALDTLGYAKITFSQNEAELDEGISICLEANKKGARSDLIAHHWMRAKDRRKKLD